MPLLIREYGHLLQEQYLSPPDIPLDEILHKELTKYVDEVALPVGSKIHYDDMFSQAVNQILVVWKELLRFH